MSTIHTPREIETIVNEGYRIDVGAHIRNGIEMLKKHPVELIGFGLVVFALCAIFSLVPIIGYFVPGLVIMPLASAAYYLFLFDAMRGKRVAFDTFSQVTGDLSRYYVIGLLVHLVKMIGFALCILPGIFAAIVLAFAIPLVIDRGMDPIEAMKASYKVAMRNLNDMVMLILVCLGLAIAGAIPCGLGLPVTLPLIYAILASVYAEVFGLSGTVVPTTGAEGEQV